MRRIKYIISDIWYVCWREMKHFMGQKVRILMNIVQPLVWLGLMGNMFSNITTIPGFPAKSYLQFMTPGVIAMTSIFMATFGGMSIVFDRRFGYLNKLLASPISRASIPMGKMLSSALQAGIQSLIIVVIALALGVKFGTGVPGVLVMILVAMLLTLAISGISLSLSAVLKTQESLMAVVNFLTMPLIFTSNAMFPTNMMPKWLASIASFNPVSFAVAPMRDLVLGNWNWGSLALDALALVGFGVLMAFISTLLFRRSVA
ncbi:MAG: ABC transporter permease [Caldiserica bacterium]|jgi:ABC-2 type transport system permease protein|nr:ABC transporter permease [Caldisericota bacterium]MDH7562393.1 ABC transporter permease [Caldisericota bacterium]